MRKSLKLIIIFSVLFLCVGCMNMNVKMNINQDKSLDLNINMSIDMFKMYKNMISSGMVDSSLCEVICKDNNTEDCINTCLNNPNLSDEEIKKALAGSITEDDFNMDEVMSAEQQEELKKQGYTININYDKNNFIYEIDMMKHINNIDDITSSEDNLVNFGDFVSGEANYLFTKNNNSYKANFKVEMDEQEEEQNMNIDMEALKEFISYNFEVNLPNKAINSNATNVSSDGKKLSWDLMSNSNINYEFNFSNKKTLSISNIDDDYLKYIGLALVGIGVISLIITTVIYVNKIK